ncbi:MAG TPA: hypothetical protein VHD83_23245 [Puia sp.]|nr:hypothetical protein [Puia sp.]
MNSIIFFCVPALSEPLPYFSPGAVRSFSIDARFALSPGFVLPATAILSPGAVYPALLVVDQPYRLLGQFDQQHWLFLPASFSRLRPFFLPVPSTRPP